MFADAGFGKIKSNLLDDAQTGVTATPQVGAVHITVAGFEIDPGVYYDM